MGTLIPDGPTLKGFYAYGWERRWLAGLDRQGIPGDAGYKLRLRVTLSLLRPPCTTFRVLDLGCGIGVYATQIARRFPQSRIVGIDLSPAHVDAASSLAACLGVSARVQFTVGDALDLKFHEPPHIVIAAELLEHLPNPDPCVNRLATLVTPGGQVLISVPQLGPTEAGGPWVYYRRPTGGNYDSVEHADPSCFGDAGEVYTYYHQHYHPDELDALLQRCGLSIRRSRTCFWQRPLSRSGKGWRFLDSLNQRAALPMFDRALLSLVGPRTAQTLIRDCIPAKARP
jgi:SAM-dependent methyltransferase